MAFDYGADPVEKVNPYKLWPTEGEMTALVDGDMLPYVVAYTSEEMRAVRAYSMAKFMYGKEGDPSDWKWIECMLAQPYFADKIDHLNITLNKWIMGAKADSAMVYMTTSNNNFRNEVAFSKPYKGQRKSEKPPFFYELRAYLLKMHNAILADDNEADDLMAIEQWRRNELLMKQGVVMGSPKHQMFADSVIVSKDKDLRIVAGWNYEPDKDDLRMVDTLGFLEPKWKDKEAIKYEWWPLFDKEPISIHSPEISKDEEGIWWWMGNVIKQDTYARGAKAGEGKTKRVKVGYETTQYIDKLAGGGLKFFYAQLLMGDTVDNYSGVLGVGCTAAYDILDNCQSEEEPYLATLQCYKDKYSAGTSNPIWVENYRGGKALLTPYQLMLEQGRLAHMQTYDGELWRDKHYCPNGEDDIWKAV